MSCERMLTCCGMCTHRESASENTPAKAMLSEAMNAMDAGQRFILGKKCKRLVDTGRLLWLREKGMEAKLVEYIAETVSPENKVLLAKHGWLINHLDSVLPMHFIKESRLSQLWHYHSVPSLWLQRAYECDESNNQRTASHDGSNVALPEFQLRERAIMDWQQGSVTHARGPHSWPDLVRLFFDHSRASDLHVVSQLVRTLPLFVLVQGSIAEPFLLSPRFVLLYLKWLLGSCCASFCSVISVSIVFWVKSCDTVYDWEGNNGRASWIVHVLWGSRRRECMQLRRYVFNP